MDENYCRFCVIIHSTAVEYCCACDEPLMVKPENLSDDARSCAVCKLTDEIEMS